MSGAVGRLGPAVPTLEASITQALSGPAADPTDPAKKKLADAAKQMEGVFVRELLKAAKVGGPKAESGYGSMAVDALADAVSEAGGLGLARRIQDALREMHAAAKDSQPTDVSSEGAGTKPASPPGAP